MLVRLALSKRLVALPAVTSTALRAQSTVPPRSIDDINREMEETFGVRPTSLMGEVAEPSEDCGRGNGSDSGSVAGGSGAPTVAEAAATATAAAMNQELFQFFGMHGTMQRQDKGAGGASVPWQHAVATAATGGALPHEQPAPEQQQQQQQAAASSNAPPGLTHVDASGRASMVDVSDKVHTVRSATAGARVELGRAAYDLVAANALAKGDVLSVAQLAGIMGAKHTATLIPLCHPLALSSVRVSLALAPQAAAVDVAATASCVGPTGVEMEALTAAAVAALTVYDMCKAVSKDITISRLRLLAKDGGRSGPYRRAGQPGAGEGPERQQQ